MNRESSKISSGGPMPNYLGRSAPANSLVIPLYPIWPPVMGMIVCLVYSGMWSSIMTGSCEDSSSGRIVSSIFRKRISQAKTRASFKSNPLISGRIYRSFHPTHDLCGRSGPTSCPFESIARISELQQALGCFNI